MAEIVGAFGTPHMPTAPGEVARGGPSNAVGQVFDAVRQHVDAVDPDVLVIFDTDHFQAFFFDNMPTFCVGAAPRTYGPAEDVWPGLPSYDVRVDEALGRHLHRTGLEQEFDLAVSQEFTIDHSIIVPLHFLSPAMQRPIVPVWINGIAPPFPRAKRCHALGKMVRAAIEAWPGNQRVAILASGVFSNDVGGPHVRDDQTTPPDLEWTRFVQQRIKHGEINDLMNAVTEERLRAAGNVAGELLNWIALLGAVDDRLPRMIELEPGLRRGNAYAAWRWD